MILVTGFAPYDGDTVNASACLIEALRRRLPAALAPLQGRLGFEIIEWQQGPPAVESRSLRRRLQALLDTYRPAVCIFTGQAKGEEAIRIEGLGVNMFMGQRIEHEGPPVYRSTLPGSESLPQVLNAARIPTEASNYAGAYLCNHILYSCLHHVHTTGQQIRAGFVHIPLTPAQTGGRYPGLPDMPTGQAVEAMSRILLHVGAAMDAE